MIRHRPHGGGDPYHLEPDQRLPPIPVEGEPLTIGALASPGIAAVTLEWSLDGTVTRLPAERIGDITAAGAWSDDTAPTDGHLAAASRRTRRRGTAWQSRPPLFRYGQTARYRFVDGSEQPGSGSATRWHEVTPARWVPDPDAVAVSPTGAGRLIADSVSVLVTAGPDGTERVHRIRFALALEPGAHVAGFGERFDRLDQRGHTLDSVVFEQYKDQAATGRTYLPMPFAHVITGAGDGWGFHVRTGRRVWFDIGRSDPDRLWVEVDTGGEPRIGRATLEVAVYRGTPAEVLAAFLAETGRPEPLPAGYTGCGSAATSGTPRPPCWRGSIGMRPSASRTGWW